MSHKKELPCGVPDLAGSAKAWLDHSQADGTGDLDLGDLADQIEASLHRQLIEEDPRAQFPGLSQSVSCERKRAYQALGHEAKPFRWSSRANFAAGDFVEAFWLFSAIQAGWDLDRTVFSDDGQAEVSLEVEGQKILGHPDGFIETNREGIIVEAKSMGQWKMNGRYNDYAAMKMIDPEGFLDVDHRNKDHWDWWGSYLGQTHGYMYATGATGTLFLFAGRDKGCVSAYFPYDPDIWERVRESWATVVRAKKQGDLPARPAEVQELRASGTKTWKGGDSFPCAYCGFHEECHSDRNAERRVEPDSGKLYLVMDR